MKWTDIPHGTVTAAEQRLWIALGDDVHKIIARINTDPSFAPRLAEFAVDAWFKYDESPVNSNKKSSLPPSFRLNFSMPREIAMVATVRQAKYDPIVEVAIYRKNFDAGQFDTSLVSEGDFGELKVRNFFPGSGCGFKGEDHKIAYIERGLQNFRGKYADIVTSNDTEFLVVWENGQFALSSLSGFLEELTAVMSGFSRTLR